MIYVFDIDGVLADITHRLHLIPKKGGDWGPFYEAAKNDQPVWRLFRLLMELAVADRLQPGPIFLLSSRPEFTRAQTWDWICRAIDYARSNIEPEYKDYEIEESLHLILRDCKPGEEGTQSGAAEARYKTDALVYQVCGEIGCAPSSVIVFEDRLAVVQQLRESGFTVLMPRINDY